MLWKGNKPVYEDIVKAKLEDELFELQLCLTARILVVVLGRQDTQRVDRLSIHIGKYCLVDKAEWRRVLGCLL